VLLWGFFAQTPVSACLQRAFAGIREIHLNEDARREVAGEYFLTGGLG